MFGNWFRTSLLMAAIVALFGVVGAALGGAQGMLVALVLGGAMNFFAYWFSDKMMIINPLAGGGIAGLFSTHPATRERIARLLAMAR